MYMVAYDHDGIYDGNDYEDDDDIDPESIEIDYPDEPRDTDDFLDADEYMTAFFPIRRISVSPLLSVRRLSKPPPQPRLVQPRTNKTCAICLEDLDGATSLLYCHRGCGQRFHTSCLQAWKKKICPLCRGTGGHASCV
uniref:RING-type domain-containing protein n=1 Tax=viral metagenome TaxID=1070528 RepID=A0A6C0BPW3_9ZZZZ